MPQGYFSETITPGTGSSATISVLSFPLQATANAGGEMAGVITAVGTNFLTNSNAGWTPGALSTAATPYLIQITSGTATGRTFLIATNTANDASDVTINSTDVSQVSGSNLQNLGIVPGTDTYKIIPADTISSVFGKPNSDGTGVLGSTIYTSADELQLYTPNVGLLTYYYQLSGNSNPDPGWTRVGSQISGANVVIRPDSGVVYARLGTTTFTIQRMGEVPSINRLAAVADSGYTILSNNWPVKTTLSSSNISKIATWTPSTSNTSSAGADLVEVLVSGVGYLQYYFDGTDWLRVGPNNSGDNVAIPAGSAVIIYKQGSATTSSTVFPNAALYSLKKPKRNPVHEKISRPARFGGSFSPAMRRRSPPSPASAAASTIPLALMISSMAGPERSTPPMFRSPISPPRAAAAFTPSCRMRSVSARSASPGPLPLTST